MLRRITRRRCGVCRRRDTRPDRGGPEADWERAEGQWESFSPPKVFHLSQRMNPRLAPDSPLYLTSSGGAFHNLGYQR